MDLSAWRGFPGSHKWCTPRVRRIRTWMRRRQWLRLATHPPICIRSSLPTTANPGSVHMLASAERSISSYNIAFTFRSVAVVHEESLGSTSLPSVPIKPPIAITPRIRNCWELTNISQYDRGFTRFAISDLAWSLPNKWEAERANAATASFHFSVGLIEFFNDIS